MPQTSRQATITENIHLFDGNFIVSTLKRLNERTNERININERMNEKSSLEVASTTFATLLAALTYLQF